MWKDKYASISILIFGCQFELQSSPSPIKIIVSQVFKILKIKNLENRFFFKDFHKFSDFIKF